MDGRGRSLSALDCSANTRGPIARGNPCQIHSCHKCGWTFPLTLRESGPVRSGTRWNTISASNTFLTLWNLSGAMALR